MKFLEPTRKPKVIYTPWNLANPVKNYPGIIVRQHLTVQRQIVLLKKAVRRIKEGTSAVLLQSGLDEKCGLILWNFTATCETYKTSCLMGYETSSENIHLNLGSSGTRRGTRNSSRRIRQADSLLHSHIKMTQHEIMRKLKMISGLLQEILFIAITLNSESNCTCGEKNHFLFR